MGLGIKYGFCSISFKSEMSQLHACQHLESVAHNQGCANNNYGRRVSYKITGIDLISPICMTQECMSIEYS